MSTIFFIENSLPVYITQSVDRVNGHDHLSQVELSHVLRDPVSKLTEQRQQVAPYIVIHHQVLRVGGCWKMTAGFKLNTAYAID